MNVTLMLLATELMLNRIQNQFQKVGKSFEDFKKIFYDDIGTIKKRSFQSVESEFLTVKGTVAVAALKDNGDYEKEFSRFDAENMRTILKTIGRGVNAKIKENCPESDLTDSEMEDFTLMSVSLALRL